MRSLHTPFLVGLSVLLATAAPGASALTRTVNVKPIIIHSSSSAASVTPGDDMKPYCATIATALGMSTELTASAAQAQRFASTHDLLTKAHMLCQAMLEDGAASSSALPLATIKSFSPMSGKTTSVVTILGTHLDTVKKIRIGTVDAVPVFKTATAIKVSIPIGAKTGKITVFTPNGAVVSTQSFTVIPNLLPITPPKPTILSFTPSMGKVGSIVTILGNNLTDATKVTFGSADTAILATVSSGIKVLVPAGATTGKITVTTPLGTTTSTAEYTVLH